MEFLTLFFVIVTCLLCAALAAASFGFRPMTFEQAVASESGSSSSKPRGPESKADRKKKKAKGQQAAKKLGLKNSGVEESEDDSMTDEDVVAGLLHARGMSLKQAETTTGKSPRAAQKRQTKTNSLTVADEGGDGLPVTAREVATAIKASYSQWNEDVISQLVALLSRSSSNENWQKKNVKGNPVVGLKKQLEEKENELRDALTQVRSLKAKYQAVRDELNNTTEKRPLPTQQTDVIQMNGAAVIANDARQSADESTHDHSSEKTGVKELKQKVRILEDALKQNVMQLNASEQARKTAETKSKELDEQMDKNIILVKKTEDLSEELFKLEGKNRSLVAELERTKTSEQTSANTYASQIEEKEKLASELENRLESVEGELEEMKVTMEQNDTELKSLRIQNACSVEMMDHERIVGEKEAVIEELRQKLIIVNQSSASHETINVEMQKYSDVINELKSSQDICTQLEARCAEQSSELDQLKSAMDDRQHEYNQKLETLNSKISEIDAELAKAADTKQKLEISYSNKCEAFQNLSAEFLSAQVLFEDRLAAEGEEKSQLMSRFEDVKLTVQQLSSDGEAKCAEIETLTAELQQAKLAISEQTSEALRKQQELQDKLEVLNADCVRFEAMNSQQCQQRHKLEDELDKLKRQSIEYVETTNELRERLSSSRAEIEHLSSTVAERSSELDKIRADNDSLRHTNDEELSQQKGIIESLRVELESATEGKNQLEKCYRDSLRELEAIKNERDEVKKSHRDELQALRDESAELVRQRDRLGEEMSSLHDQLQSATEEKNLLGRELEAMKNKYDEFSKSHEEKLQAVRDESSHLVNERDRLSKELSNIEISCNEKSSEIERLNSELASRTAELQEELSQQKGIIESLRVELESATEGKNQLEKCYRDSLTELEAIKNERDEVKKSFEEKLQAVCDESSHLASERDRLKGELGSLETSCSHKSSEIDRLNSQLASSTAELQDELLQQKRLNESLLAELDATKEEKRQLENDSLEENKILAKQHDDVKKFYEEQLAVKSGTLTSVFSEVERLKEENWRLEKQCNNTSRQLELVNRESTNDSEETLDAVRSELETKSNEIVELNRQLAERSEDLGRAKSDLEETKKTCREQLAVKVLNLSSVFSEVDRLKEENTRLEKICNDRAREIGLMREQIKN